MAAIIAFIQAHTAIFTGFGIAVLDLLFALIPGLQANGVLHQIYLWFGGKAS